MYGFSESPTMKFTTSLFAFFTLVIISQALEGHDMDSLEVEVAELQSVEMEDAMPVVESEQARAGCPPYRLCGKK
uniref:U4-Austrotoxin-Ht1a_2 n=2 Tax=Hickmania troglodytes TaxID=489260 RepID=A0A482Z978_9ARAC